MHLTKRLTQSAQRTIDLFLRVKPSQVMNQGPSIQISDDPAAALMRASKELLAEGIDTSSGMVNYSGLKQSETYQRFKELTRSLPSYSLQGLGAEAEKLAFWLNIYNALIIDAIIQFNLKKNIMRNPGIFRNAAYNIGRLRFSADDIEHGILRRNRPNPVLPFRPFHVNDPRLAYMVDRIDPRIHFALVCGAKSCPPITYYSSDRLEPQLNAAAATFINSDAVRWEPAESTLWLSKIFDWYKVDFGGAEGILALIRQYSRNNLIRQLPPVGNIKFRYHAYDWNINQT
jgi:hypothetical protein